MTNLEPLLILAPSERLRDLCHALIAGALLASMGWIWLYMADTEAWSAKLDQEQARVAEVLAELSDRCPVPEDGQVVGSRKAGRAMCLPMPNLKLPEIPRK